MNLSICLQIPNDGRILSVKVLLDNGSMRSCMSWKFVENNQISTKQVAKSIPIYNVDATLNKSKTIKAYVEIWMIIQNHVKRIQFAVPDLGEANLFIRYEWLKKHNPDVNWRASTFDFLMNVDTWPP